MVLVIRIERKRIQISNEIALLASLQHCSLVGQSEMVLAYFVKTKNKIMSGEQSCEVLFQPLSWCFQFESRNCLYCDSKINHPPTPQTKNIACVREVKELNFHKAIIFG